MEHGRLVAVRMGTLANLFSMHTSLVWGVDSNAGKFHSDVEDIFTESIEGS